LRNKPTTNLICCFLESRSHTWHINRLLSEPPTYYWRRQL